MAVSRSHTLLSLFKGLLVSIALTLICMAGVAALAVFTRISDNLLMLLNQLMKLAAILLGCLAAIGRGGERGFFTGMALAMLYMALGYACCAALGGGFIVSQMLGEILTGAAVGAITGAVLSNLSPAGRRRAKPA
ncbi:MAG: TIGR04086 family membrane protein [Clostridia bacterium]|nr:TIGR04086 family membrane protein [Clostridia bacterium]